MNRLLRKTTKIRLRWNWNPQSKACFSQLAQFWPFVFDGTSPHCKKLRYIANIMYSSNNVHFCPSWRLQNNTVYPWESLYVFIKCQINLIKPIKTISLLTSRDSRDIENIKLHNPITGVNINLTCSAASLAWLVLLQVWLDEIKYW